MAWYSAVNSYISLNDSWWLSCCRHLVLFALPRYLLVCSFSCRFVWRVQGCLRGPVILAVHDLHTLGVVWIVRRSVSGCGVGRAGEGG